MLLLQQINFNMKKEKTPGRTEEGTLVLRNYQPQEAT